MKYVLATILLFVSTSVWAEPTSSQLERLRGLCNNLPGLQKSKPPQKKEFCDCFVTEMRKLDQADATLMIQFLSGERDVKEIEAVSRIIPEFEYNVEEHCQKK